MMGLPLAPADAAPDRKGQRATAAALMLLLHGLLLLAVLHAIIQPGIRARAEREMTLVLGPPPHLRTATSPPPPHAPSARAIILPPPQFAPPPSVPAPDVGALGRSLFGCAPEALGNLPAEQRAHCGFAVARPDDSAMAELPSQVKDPTLREAEMAAKNTPLRVPCTYLEEQVIGTIETYNFMVDPVCAAKQARQLNH